MKTFKNVPTHHPFLKDMLKYIFYQDEGICQERGTHEIQKTSDLSQGLEKNFQNICFLKDS